MFTKMLSNLLVLAIVVGYGYAPEGATGIQARILGERAAISDCQRQLGDGCRSRVISKSSGVDESGRVFFRAVCESF